MSISSAVVSFFTYFQNLSVNIKLPHINFPPWFLAILKVVNDFVAKIQYYTLQIPPFDMRTQLILASVILPFLLEIVFVWLVQPLLLTLLSIIDILSIFALFFLLAYAFTVHWNAVVSVLISVLLLYFIIRIIIKIKKRRPKFKMISLARDICNHYLYGIIPEIQIEHSIDELNNTIQQFSKIVEIKPSPHILYITIIFFSISAVSFLVSFYFFNIYPFLKAPFTKQINILVGVIFLLIGLLFFVIFLLRIFQCGRKFIMQFKQFCKRWGLRILMLCFDLLYIPNVTLIISHINVKKISPCPQGQYLYQLPNNYGNTLSYLIEHQTTCMNCSLYPNMSYFSKCIEMCTGKAKYRPVDDNTLEFIKDIIPYSSGFIVWGVIFVIIGIPLLWCYIIRQNRQFAFVINVYGEKPSVKWLKIVNRMKTTGIFLFVNYKYNNSRWSVLYLLVKFLAMILSTIASRFFKYLSLSLSVMYLLIFITVVSIKPYLYLFNNLLDSILYFTQFIFSLNTSLAIFNINVPDLAATILSIVIIVVPVISMIFLLFFKRKSANFEDDPTYPQKLTKDEEEELNMKRQKAKDRLKSSQATSEDNDDDDEDDVFVLKEDDEKVTNKRKRKKNSKNKNNINNINNNNNSSADDVNMSFKNSNDMNQPLLDQANVDDVNGADVAEQLGSESDCFELEEFDENENLCLIPEDEYEVHQFDLLSVNQCVHLMHELKHKVEPEDGENTYIVNKRVLASRMTSMYEMLDVVIDGFTIDLVTKVLNFSIICGMGAFGWYIGSIYSNNDIIKPPVCHFV